MSNPYWFNRKERIFKRETEIQTGKWLDRSDWIPVPCLYEYDLYKDFLYITGREGVIGILDCEDERDFCIKLRFYSDANRFNSDLNQYEGQIICTLMYKWMVENKIANARICRTPVPVEFWDLPQAEAIVKISEYQKNQFELEKTDEQAYKAKISCK